MKRRSSAGTRSSSVLSYTGYEAGGVAPFGHVVTPAHTFVEERVFANEVVWCGGGIRCSESLLATCCAVPQVRVAIWPRRKSENEGRSACE